MIKGKTHLTLAERKQIELGLEKRLSLGEIARSFDKSTEPDTKVKHEVQNLDTKALSPKDTKERQKRRKMISLYRRAIVAALGRLPLWT